MKISHAATVFPVSDVSAALRYYIDVLGFREEFRFGEYAGIGRDGCLLHLSRSGNPNTGPPGAGAVYIFCDEVDEYFSDIVSRGATIADQPKDYDYGLRDFIVRDPDGNQLTFGAPVKKPGS